MNVKKKDVFGHGGEKGKDRRSFLLSPHKLKIKMLNIKIQKKKRRKPYETTITVRRRSKFLKIKKKFILLIYMSKKSFLFNPDDPKKSFDVYIDKDPKILYP